MRRDRRNLASTAWTRNVSGSWEDHLASVIVSWFFGRLGSGAALISITLMANVQRRGSGRPANSEHREFK
jgi:hypothetical protein